MYLWNQCYIRICCQGYRLQERGEKIIKFDIHITIFTILAPGVIFRPSVTRDLYFTVLLVQESIFLQFRKHNVQL